MGIVRLSERDAVRFLTFAREREGWLASTETRWVGRRLAAVAVVSADGVPEEGARHTAGDPTGVRGVPPPKNEG
jgi:hypothetical protein